MRKKDVDRQIAFDAAADALRRVHEPSMSRTGRAPAPASTASARSSPSTCRSACSSLSSAAVGATGANSSVKLLLYLRSVPGLTRS
jgi:hypothetical protein